MYFDSHAHLDDEKFDSDREELIGGLAGWDVIGVVNPGVDIASSRVAVNLAEKYDFIYAAVGVHPHEARAMSDADLEYLAKMAARSEVVAIGEIGLDYYYDFSPKNVQKRRFIEQIELAYRLNLPIIVHDRDAHGDTLEIIRSRRGRIHGGVMHCFSGSWEMAKECMDLGFYISFGGTVTFKNAKRPVEIVKNIDLDRLLIETDSPYLTPQPYRGKRNQPGYVRFVAQKIADIRGMRVEEIARITARNAMELFKINRRKHQ